MLYTSLFATQFKITVKLILLEMEDLDYNIQHQKMN